MKNLMISSVFMFVIFSSAQAFSYTHSSVGDDLCSPQGLMKLVPQLKNKNGNFELPNPNKNLGKFLHVYSALRTIIQSALVQAQYNANPYNLASNSYKRLKIGDSWLASEVGFEVSNGTDVPDYSKGGFGSYDHDSFMHGIEKIKGTGGAFYAVEGKGVYISPMPTILRCVNLAMETSSHDAGSFITPSYILGTKEGHAYMIINGCQNPASMTKISGQTVLKPAASAYLGIQYANPLPGMAKKTPMPDGPGSHNLRHIKSKASF